MNGRAECCSAPAGEIFASPKRSNRPRPISFSRTCEQCGVNFQTRASHGKFCSSQCRAAHHSQFTNPRIGDCCTVAELSAGSGIDAAAIRRMIRSGDIRAFKVGRLYLVHRNALDGVAKPEPDPLHAQVGEIVHRFAEERGLSCADLAVICGFSRTAAHRLLHGKLPKNFFTKIFPSLPPELAENIAHLVS